jgi:hypothetical protein
MAAVSRGEHVIWSHHGADAGGDGLLADVLVGDTSDLVVVDQLNDEFLERAD